MTLSIQELQIVVFAPSATVISASKIYEEFMNEEATTSQTNKFARPENPFLSLANGQIGDTDITVQTQDGRLDIYFRAKQNPSQPTDLHSIDLTSHMNKVLDKFDSISDRARDCYRQAIVVNHGIGYDNEEDAIGAFLDETGARIPRHGLSVMDLSLQFNLRTTLSSGTPINRLNKISIDLLAFYQGMLPAFPLAQHGLPQPIRQSFILNHVNDYNTVPTGTIEAHTQKDKISEMFEMLIRDQTNAQ